MLSLFIPLEGIICSSLPELRMFLPKGSFPSSAPARPRPSSSLVSIRSDMVISRAYSSPLRLLHRITLSAAAARRRSE